jgi:hypothetical protein
LKRGEEAVKLKQTMLWMVACWLLLSLACQTLMGTEEPASTSVPQSTAVSETEPVSTATSAVVASPTTETVEPTATEGSDEPVIQVTPVSGGWDDLVVFNGLSQAHDDDLREDYGSLPPAGGPHNPTWVQCGFYEEPVWTEQAIHSLEHGTVWITYRPELPADQINYLSKLPQGHTHILVTPWPGLASDVVLTAWGLQLQIPSLPDERIAEFIERYEQGPQNPEPGAPC